MRRLNYFAVALWWGSLTLLGFVVVPLLFANLPTPAMAGGMAAKLFTAQTWVSVVCCLLLWVVYRSGRNVEGDPAAQTTMVLAVTGLLLALLAEFVIAPRIIARDNLKLWHGVGSAMYLVQWLCALGAVWRASDRR